MLAPELTLNPRTEAAAATETGEDLRSRILTRYLTVFNQIGSVGVCEKCERETVRERDSERRIEC